MRRAATVLPLLSAGLLALTLTACSGDAEPGAGGGPSEPATSVTSSGTSSPSSPSAGPTDIEELVASLPPCAEVWVADQVLPADYAGCKLPGGGIDLGAVLECVDGAGLAAYRERFWAHLGEPVEDSGGGGTQQDPEYATAVGLCQGE
ncbi:hypothetical protein [Nocardioides deserti]|uniref:Secreted protein n=1 Tax=Nocardioides deserti TaxID=1588644 RepID=A0ABR6U5H7_9ACTN|nr:hypothetical protein [Nocardioides deserti]MBC2959560.1 hypothetical protein [Nocardioides deserti]GGO73900.1 hypothetical protein GCM10012276_20620 [Nocardioides deserti]